MNVLQVTIRDLFSPGKGLLAADESTESVGKRLDPIGVESTPENRRRFRELFLAAEGAGQYMSGVILVDETLRQSDGSGTSFPALLSKNGIVPGVKVDGGAKEFPGFPGERFTEGLDRLGDRLHEYAELGARFAKWRAAFHLGKGLPTNACIRANALQLALYAGRCIEAGIVPIVEPEVVREGTHGIGEAERVTTAILKAVIDELKAFRIDLATTIVKTSMVIPGDKSGASASPEEVAEATVRCLRNAIPEGAGGVVFLSGGQTSEEATLNLNAIAKLGPFSWPLTFCYARALQYPATDVWAGKDENLGTAREAFIARLRANAAASTGNYS